MKVLMFGWEFPPHISGGLGTACFGLTQSLLEQKVKVLFVVPRLHGDERGSDIVLSDASGVRITKGVGKMHPAAVAHSEPSQLPSSAGKKSKRKTAWEMKRKSGMTYIEAPVVISPYEQPKFGNTHATDVTAWNYVFPASPYGFSKTTGTPVSPEKNMQGEEPQDRYLFSGSYGNNLMEEVARYATVARVVAVNYKFDVIHVHDWMTFPAGISAKEISKKPLVVHVHSTEFDRSGEKINDPVFRIEKRGFIEADAIITVSNWTKDILVSNYGIPEGKITVIHNGITPREQPEEFDFPDLASHFVTFLGRVTHQKGPRFFVEAAQRVLNEFPDAHFIVAGAGDLLPQMIERVAQLNMSANFHFTGFLSGEQVDQVWSMTDVYVMPSVSEPFGIAPLEAIQGGVPVILSNQSGVSEVMPHAIKVDFWDVKALAAAICSVLRYESLSHVLRQNSKQHIQHLTWNKAASNVKALYHELTGNQ